MHPRAFTLGILLAAWATPSRAQLISIRTVPITQSHQFDFFPSLRGGMGRVSLAVDDSLLDPFLNPATGARLRASRFFVSPSFYSVSRGAGAGRSLPLGAWLRAGKWFGGVALAAQQVDLSDNDPFLPPPCEVCLAAEGETIDLPPDDRSLGNAFGYAMLGGELGGGLSIGGSAAWADLDAVDGTDLMYANSLRLRQNGHSLDVRIGALKEWEGARALSALVLHNRYAASHDVFYLDQVWDPGIPGFSQRPRQEANRDRTNTWGLHLEYVQPIANTGWRVGWVATGNRTSQPEIANYEIQNVPRHPGNSEAYNFGVGFSRTEKHSTFALDLIYQPIWSHTWAGAEAATETARGIIPAGGKTIENRFRFSNTQLRVGLSQDHRFNQDTKSVGFQLGLVLDRIDYALRQDDNVMITTSHRHENWIEWTPTWGLSLSFPAWELRYRGSLINGTGRPGVASNDFVLIDPIGPFFPGPGAPLTLRDIRVTTHQIGVTIPLAVSR
jgi:hypothetical protein